MIGPRHGLDVAAPGLPPSGRVRWNDGSVDGVTEIA